MGSIRTIRVGVHGKAVARRRGSVAGAGGRRRGFGCVFGLVFLLVAGSLVATTGFILSHFGGLAALIVLVVVAAILVAVGRGFRSSAATLDELVEATRAVEAGDYTVRVGPKPRGLRPVRQLVAGFDTMAARLETDERQRRTLLAEISHELRTPLTVVQGNLEAIIDGVYPPDPAHLAIVLDETRVLARLIDDLRTLALSEAGTLALHREPTDPELLVADVVRSFEAAAAAVGVRADDRHRGRPAHRGHRSGAHPGGLRQPRRQRPAPHACRWPGHGPRRDGDRLDPARGRVIRDAASSLSCCRTSSTGS